MSIQYDENGLVIQTLTEILTERQNKCQEFLGNDFDITGESVAANLQVSDADRELSIQECLQYIAAQLDPDQAEGIWLDFICALNNIERYSATKTQIPITITGTPGVSKIAGDVMIVDGTTDEYYINQSAFVLDDNGVANVIFEATSWGAIKALPTSEYSLKTPSVGISSVKYNTDGKYTIGQDIESDNDLRSRREESVTYTASSILSSIKAAVLSIQDVSYINAYENDTMQTIDTLPAKSFEIVVQGGDDTAIAQAILSRKPAGIQAYGTTIEEVQDEDGNKFQIGFTRPTQVPIDLKFTFVSDTQQTDEWVINLKNELIEQFNDVYNVGDSVYTYNLYCVLNNHTEITNVTEFKAKRNSDTDTSWNDSVAISTRELATLSADNITITQSV